MEGFFALPVWVLIFGGAYLWNFMVTQAHANLNFFRFTWKVRVIGN